MADPVPHRVPTVSIINPLVDPAWDGHCQVSAASFFHTSAWARVLAETYDFRPQYFIAADTSAARTLLPVFEVNSWLTGRRGICLPYTDECSPLAADATQFQTTLSAALTHGKSRHWRYLEVRGGRQLLGETPAAISYWGHTLQLTPDPAIQFSRLADSHRRAVRKAEQGGLVIEFATSVSAMREFYVLHCRTRRKHGLPPQPWSFFANIHRHIMAAGKGRIALAKGADAPVAGAIFFHHGSTALFKFGASEERWQHLRTNNFVMWRAIGRYADEGYGLLDFGRTSRENTGLRQFKLGWGADEHAVEYFRFRPTGGFDVASDQASGWHNAFFRRLPSSLARLAGSFLYKHIA